MEKILLIQIKREENKINETMITKIIRINTRNSMENEIPRFFSSANQSESMTPPQLKRMENELGEIDVWQI